MLQELGDLWKIANGARTAIFGDETDDLLKGLGGMAKGTFGLVCDGTSSFGEMAGPAGGALGGVIDMGTGIYDMVEHSDQMGQGAFFNDEGGRNQFWGGAGDASLGALHTAINACALLGPEAVPIVAGVDKALGIGEGAVNALGTGVGLAGSALGWATGTEHDWGFDSGDVVGGVEHAVASTGLATADALMNGGPGTGLAAAGGALAGGTVGMTASMMTGGLLAPLIPMLAAGGGALGSSLMENGVMGTAEAITEWL